MSSTKQRQRVMHRCDRHRRNWVIWQWVWEPIKGETEEDSEPECLRECSTCAREREEELDDES